MKFFIKPIFIFISLLPAASLYAAGSGTDGVFDDCESAFGSKATPSETNPTNPSFKPQTIIQVNFTLSMPFKRRGTKNLDDVIGLLTAIADAQFGGVAYFDESIFKASSYFLNSDLEKLVLSGNDIYEAVVPTIKKIQELGRKQYNLQNTLVEKFVHTLALPQFHTHFQATRSLAFANRSMGTLRVADIESFKGALAEKLGVSGQEGEISYEKFQNKLNERYRFEFLTVRLRDLVRLYGHAFANDEALPLHKNLNEDSKDDYFEMVAYTLIYGQTADESDTKSRIMVVDDSPRVDGMNAYHFVGFWRKFLTKFQDFTTSKNIDAMEDVSNIVIVTNGKPIKLSWLFNNVSQNKSRDPAQFLAYKDVVTWIQLLLRYSTSDKSRILSYPRVDQPSLYQVILSNIETFQNLPEEGWLQLLSTSVVTAGLNRVWEAANLPVTQVGDGSKVHAALSQHKIAWRQSQIIFMRTNLSLNASKILPSVKVIDIRDTLPEILKRDMLRSRISSHEISSSNLRRAIKECIPKSRRNEPVFLEFVTGHYLYWTGSELAIRKLDTTPSYGLSEEISISFTTALNKITFAIDLQKIDTSLALQKPVEPTLDDRSSLEKAASLIKDKTPSTLSLKLMERAFADLLTMYADGNPEEFTVSLVSNISVDVDGTEISGIQLVKAYHDALRKERPVDGAKLRPIDSVKYYLEYNHGYKKYDNSQLSNALAEHKLTDLLEIFEGRPELFAQAMQLWHREIAPNIEFQELIEQYAGIVQIKPISKIKPESDVNREKFVRLRLDSNDQSADSSLIQFQSELEILVRMSRQDFEKDPLKLLESLESERQLLSQSNFPSIHEKVLLRYQRLYQSAIEHFHNYQNFSVAGVRSSPFAYQKEGVNFLVNTPRALLADEAGLGKTFQAIAAVETIRYTNSQVEASTGRTLWISDKTNLGNLRNEIKEHSFVTDDEIMTLEGGDVKKREEMIRSLLSPNSKVKYILANYEQLRVLHLSWPDLFQILDSEEQILIVDEAQLIDNPVALRSQAVRALSPERVIFLTATPYQGDPARVFTLLNYLAPETFPSFDNYLARFPSTADGARALRQATTPFILRRTKDETIPTFENPNVISFLEQLANGVPRHPKKIVRDPLRYQLSPDQTMMIASIIKNFTAWAAAHNAKPDLMKIDLTTLNSLNQLHWINTVMYEPAKVGLTDHIDIGGDQLRNRVRDLASQGKKVILWVHNQSVVEKMAGDYLDLKPALLYGNPNIDRNAEISRFQNDPDCLVLIASYGVGAMGLSLTAADEAIVVQVPPTFSRLYQLSNRHDRAISLARILHARENVGIGFVVPEFDATTLESLHDEKLSSIMGRGTITEQTLRRLQGAEMIYRIFLEGYQQTTNVDQYLNTFLIQSIRYE